MVSSPIVRSHGAFRWIEAKSPAGPCARRPGAGALRADDVRRLWELSEWLAGRVTIETAVITG
jgi:hypothetical protein